MGREPLDLYELLFMVIIVTASGALAPGPLFFANISEGMRSGARAGLLFSIGHTIIEFPLVILLALGLLKEVTQPLIRSIIGLLGGCALVLFGILQIKESLKTNVLKTAGRDRVTKNPLILGVLFTGLNPFFIIWWLSVGAKLIVEALLLAQIFGVLIMFVAHIWMDYAWLIGTAYLSKIGVNLIGSRVYRILIFAFGIVLILFGINFLLNSL